MEIDFYNEIRAALDESRFPQELLDKYELLECLSSGDDHETLLVKSRTGDALCVAKCYHAGHPLFSEAEPEAIRGLSHPALPRFICEYNTDKMRCILRQYVEGKPLDKLPVPAAKDVARSICAQLCGVLSYLHNQTPPIIHRDIKPQNVIISDDGKISLIDFGISRVFNKSARGDTVAFGTQAFAPPEQYGFSQTDCRSDIYSLGVLLCWLLTGNVSLETLGNSHLDHIAAKCAAFDPCNRYKNAGDVMRAIQRSQPAQIKRRRHIGSFIAAALIFVLAILALNGQNIQTAKGIPADITFSEPLVEQAVRTVLKKDAGEPLYEHELLSVTEIYIVADRALSSADEFYSAVSDWYSGGRPGRGSVQTLSDTEHLPNLKTICIAAEKISDASPLSRLKALEKVELKHNNISDITPLGALENLVSVGLNDNPVKDISPLKTCPRLRYLDLCSVNCYDPKVIAELGDFMFLDIANKTRSYQYLAGKSVMELKLGWTNIRDLDFLAEIKDLEVLEINNTAVTDLTELAAHPAIRELRLSGLGVDSLSILLELPELEKVTLSQDMKHLIEGLKIKFNIQYE